MSPTYLAAVAAADGALTLRALERPALGATDIRLRVLACGICGSDVASIMRGEFVEAGQVLGHEVALEVIEAGDGHGDRFPAGTKLAILSSRSCGACPYCVRGQPYLCDRSRALSVGYGIPGGFAEEMVFPDVDPVTDVVVLPPHLDPRDALWVEPLSVAIHALERSGADAESRLLVIGAGSVGLAVIAAAAARGIVPIVAEPRDERREAALSLGARQDGGTDVSAIIDTSGSAAAIESHLPRLRDRGVLTLVGLGGRPLPPLPRGIEARASFAFSADDWRNSVDAIATGAVSLGALVNVVVPLDRTEQTARSLAVDPSLIKAAVVPGPAVAPAVGRGDSPRE